MTPTITAMGKHICVFHVHTNPNTPDNSRCNLKLLVSHFEMIKHFLHTGVSCS